jgi:hypothetical protein
MKQNSEDEQALTKIQHDWAEARIKGDSSPGVRLGPRGRTKSFLGGKFVGTDTFMKQHGVWKVVASQITPVLKK